MSESAAPAVVWDVVKDGVMVITLQRPRANALGLPIIGFLGLTLFSFLLGSGGSPDSLTLHNYFKFLLGVLFFFSVVNCVRTEEQATWALRLMMIGGALAALCEASQ